MVRNNVMDHAQERHSYPGNPFQQIAKRLRRAARNGTAFHLPPELVPALLASDAMPIILDLETREIRAGLKCPKPQIACRDDGSLETSGRSEEHTSELQSLMRISYAVFCLKKKQK